MNDEVPKLRKTTATIITEDAGEFLGLPGGSIFLVLGTFTVTQVLTKKMFLALFLALGVYAILRYWLRGKPDHYLRFWIWERFAPKKYRHRADTQEPRSWTV